MLRTMSCRMYVFLSKNIRTTKVPMFPYTVIIVPVSTAKRKLKNEASKNAAIRQMTRYHHPAEVAGGSTQSVFKESVVKVCSKRVQSVFKSYFKKVCSKCVQSVFKSVFKACSKKVRSKCVQSVFKVCSKRVQSVLEVCSIKMCAKRVQSVFKVCSDCDSWRVNRGRGCCLVCPQLTCCIFDGGVSTETIASAASPHQESPKRNTKGKAKGKQGRRWGRQGGKGKSGSAREPALYRRW